MQIRQEFQDYASAYIDARVAPTISRMSSIWMRLTPSGSVSPDELEERDLNEDLDHDVFHRI
jgi:hypothetical protein